MLLLKLGKKSSCLREDLLSFVAEELSWEDHTVEKVLKGVATRPHCGETPIVRS